MEKPQKMPKVAKVKNKAPAEVQITAEQLLREAKERDLEILPPPPKQKISDPAELADYQQRKRKTFEDNLRKNRMVVSHWIKYAQWEESQKEIQRARSIWERALDNDHRNVTMWLKYAEMEMKNKQVNHARNLWDRAISILPRVNQFWYKYTYMEEMLENVAGARQVFERWMEWQPEEQAWQTYVNFELRYKEIDRARAIYERFVYVHPDVKNWIKFARFEETHGFIHGARRVYERAVEFFGDDYIDERLFIAFARFEEGQKEHDRARVIYKYALEHLPKDKTQDLYKAYTVHEKKYGDRAGIEDVIVSKRKFQYEQEVASNPQNYDAWFDYLRLIESEGDADLIRETYERAISNVPPGNEKNFWRRYIYLWINYALYEELETGDTERTRQIYKTCLELIPHKQFTFSKVWLYYAQFEIRCKNLQKARKIMGMAIGMCPRDKLFRGYIELEIQLREFDRCRLLYEKFLDFGPENCVTWMKFAELESLLGDVDRARAIYELAIQQPRLDMPELLWKAYIDFEVSQGESELARQLYERLLERTHHVKVWISYAKFELTNKDANSDDDHDDMNILLARRVYEKANETLRQLGDKEPRVLLLESWRDFEKENGDHQSLHKVMEKLPRRIKRRQKIVSEEGVEEGWEEIFDYIFPEDEMARPNLKLLAAAKMWKKQKEDPPQETSPEVPEEENQEDSNNGTTPPPLPKEKPQNESESESESESDSDSSEESGSGSSSSSSSDSSSDSSESSPEKAKSNTRKVSEENKKDDKSPEPRHPEQKQQSEDQDPPKGS